MTTESPYAKRIRAARAYANMSQDDLAKELGWEVQTVKRRESGKKDPKRAELIAIASICQVPLAFLEGGFPAAMSVEADERLARIEAAIAGLATDDDMDLRNATRGAAAGLADQLGDAAQDDEADTGTRGTEDATQGSAQARGGRTR